MKTRRVMAFAALAAAVVAVVLGFMSYGGWDLPLGVRSLVRENAVRKATAETENRRERREFDLKYLKGQLAALRDDPEALVIHRYGDAAAWVRNIRAAYFASTPCYAFLRWRAGDSLRSYFQRKPDRRFATVEDLNITRPDIEKLWREAGVAAAEKLIQALRIPRVTQLTQRCDLEDVVAISEAIIDILIKLDLTPEDFGTTPAKIVALVRAAR